MSFPRFLVRCRKIGTMFTTYSSIAADGGILNTWAQNDDSYKRRHCKIVIRETFE